MSDLPNPSEFKTHTTKLVKNSYESLVESAPLEKVEREFDSFEPISFKHHREELLNLSPYWLYKEANSADVELFKKMSRYDKKNNTFVTGVYSNSELDFKLISYKRRRFNGGKWVTRKGTHPNNTPLVRIFTDDEPIYVIEGHHDTLTAILLGIDFIMVPTASYIGHIEVLTGRNVVFMVEDGKAYAVMKRLAHEASNSANSVAIKRYINSEDCDLSDFTANFSSIEEVQNALRSA